MNWRTLQFDDHAATQLAKAAGVHPVTAGILSSRGLGSAADINDFLEPSLARIPDPFELPNMRAAVLRLAAAIEKNENVAIFGDYDADGICGAALLSNFLHACGLSPSVHLPNRFDGYGLSKFHIARIAKEGSTLLITVDNGMRAVEEVSLARELGLDVIVTDHHESGRALPDAAAVVNPHLLDRSHALFGLSGCGVAFMLMLAARKYLREQKLFNGAEPNLKRELDLVAIGTIADVMPLTKTNRILAKFGLDEIRAGSRLSIAELLRASSTEPSSVNASSVAFRIAPRINAAGRLDDPTPALQMLLADDANLARNLAAKLDDANNKRKSLEKKIIEESNELIDAALKKNRRGIVVYSDTWHLGVIGIAAGKISEASGLPAVVISKGIIPARGSARAPEGANLVALLSAVPSGTLLGFGGHTQAAGLTIEHGRIAEFVEQFDDACRRADIPAASDTLTVDAVIDAKDICRELAVDLGRLEPFGEGNREPVLAINGADIIEKRLVGDGHAKLTLYAGGKRIDAIAFRMAERFDGISGSVDLAFNLQMNNWNGVESVQLKVVDVRS